MATTTAAVACPAGSWTLLVDGAAHKSCGIQIASLNHVKIAVAGSAPAADSDAWFLLAINGDRSVTLDLVTADKVYGQGQAGAGTVRLYKVGV